MQSDLLTDLLTDPLADRRLTEGPIRTSRSSRADRDKAVRGDRMSGAQQFLVEWEVPDPT